MTKSNNQTVHTTIPTMRERLSSMRLSASDILTPAYVALNYGRDLVGVDLLGKQMDISIDGFHSPKAQAQILKNNLKGIKTSYLNEHLKTANAGINTHLVASLTHTTTGFESALQALEPLLQDAVQGERAQKKQKLLTEAQTKLEPTRRLNDELDLFRLRMETLQELLDSNSVDNPRDIAAYIKDQYEYMLKQLKLKKETDLATIKKTIEELRAKNTQNGGPFLSESDISSLEATLKKNNQEAFDKSEKELDKLFKTGTPPDKKDEHDSGKPSLFSEFDSAAQRAEAEIINFVLFNEMSKSKKIVESEQLNAHLGAGLDGFGRKYRDISFDDYANSTPERDHSWVSPTAWFQYGQFLMNNRGELTTPSGIRFSCANGVLSFSFPPHRSPFYHYQDRNIGATLMIAIKKQIQDGFDGVTLNLKKCDDPKLRKKIMEEFYYCAHLAGIPDDKIKFQVCACPGETSEEEKKPIDNKKASEIMGRLGRGPQRAQAKKRQWQQEQSVLDKDTHIERQRSVAELGERIDSIIGQDKPAISAVARYI